MSNRMLHARPLFSVMTCVLLLCGGWEQSPAQKLGRNRPGVYVTFQGFVGKTAEPDYPSGGARLVLHNNTRWPVYYGKWLDPTLPGDVAMIYNVVSADGCPQPRRHVEVMMDGKLMPGRSVSFVVPREELTQGNVVHVDFDFSWELTDGRRFPGEAEHRAYFISSDLPHWPL